MLKTLAKDFDGGESLLSQREAMKQAFSTRLHRMLMDRGWSQSELARRSGLTRDNISVYVTGRGIPSHASMLKLASALNVPVAKLAPEHYVDAGRNGRAPYKLTIDDSGKANLHVDIEGIDADLAIQIIRMLRDESVDGSGSGDAASNE